MGRKGDDWTGFLPVHGASYLILLTTAEGLVSSRQYGAAAIALNEAAQAMGDHPMRAIVEEWADSLPATGRMFAVRETVARSPIIMKEA